jgi:4'-phosphopantetheinyl transferase
MVTFFLIQMKNLNPLNRNTHIHPVILKVPAHGRDLTGREKVNYLSRLARVALELSAGRQGKVFGNLEKDENGAPLPVNGNHWSLTHKPEYVGAVMAPGPIGIDIEKIRPCSQALFNKTATPSEWNLWGKDPTPHLFFRYWTSKEAVLKAAGVGIKGLSSCTINCLIDNNNTEVNYRGKSCTVEHFLFDGHIASVIKNSYTVRWSLHEKAPGPQLP